MIYDLAIEVSIAALLFWVGGFATGLVFVTVKKLFRG